jgi:hypothetical protein
LRRADGKAGQRVSVKNTAGYLKISLPFAILLKQRSDLAKYLAVFYTARLSHLMQADAVELVSILKQPPHQAPKARLSTFPCS